MLFGSLVALLSLLGGGPLAITMEFTTFDPWKDWLAFISTDFFVICYLALCFDSFFAVLAAVQRPANRRQHKLNRA